MKYFESLELLSIHWINIAPYELILHSYRDLEVDRCQSTLRVVLKKLLFFTGFMISVLGSILWWTNLVIIIYFKLCSLIVIQWKHLGPGYIYVYIPLSQSTPDNQYQETFLAPSADKQTHNYDTECSKHHLSINLKVKKTEP